MRESNRLSDMERNDALAALSEVEAIESRSRGGAPVWLILAFSLVYGAGIAAATLDSMLWTLILLVLLVLVAVAWFIMRGRRVRESTRQPVDTEETWSWKKNWVVLLPLGTTILPGLLRDTVGSSWPVAIGVGALGAVVAFLALETDRRQWHS